jgi:hypothetical protein
VVPSMSTARLHDGCMWCSRALPGTPRGYRRAPRPVPRLEGICQPGRFPTYADGEAAVPWRAQNVREAVALSDVSERVCGLDHQTTR